MTERESLEPILVSWWYIGKFKALNMKAKVIVHKLQVYYISTKTKFNLIKSSVSFSLHS